MLFSGVFSLVLCECVFKCLMWYILNIKACIQCASTVFTATIIGEKNDYLDINDLFNKRTLPVPLKLLNFSSECVSILPTMSHCPQFCVKHSVHFLFYSTTYTYVSSCLVHFWTLCTFHPIMSVLLELAFFKLWVMLLFFSLAFL